LLCIMTNIWKKMVHSRPYHHVIFSCGSVKYWKILLLALETIMLTVLQKITRLSYNTNAKSLYYLWTLQSLSCYYKSYSQVDLLKSLSSIHYVVLDVWKMARDYMGVTA
jgi:hypothetical protein